MEKRIVTWCILSAVILFLVPWLLVSFVPANAGMLATIFLLLILNPLYAAAVGILSGQAVKALWSLPLLSTALFCCSAWFFFQMYISALCVYAGVYLVIGAAIMLLTAQICHAKNANGSAR